MKRTVLAGLIIAGVLIAGQGFALTKMWSKFDGTKANTYTLTHSACYIDHVIVSNNENVPRYVNFFDTPAYKFTVALGAMDSQRIQVKSRIATGLVVYVSGGTMAVSVHGESYAYGHYMYSTIGSTSAETLYNGAGSLIGVIVSNIDSSDTGKWVLIEDGSTDRLRITVPVNETKYIDCDRIPFSTWFQVTPSDTEVGVAIIRRR